jgi:hypothetical protein
MSARDGVSHPLRLHAQPPALPSAAPTGAARFMCGSEQLLWSPHPESDRQQGAGARPAAAGVRERAANGRTTRILSSLGRTAASSTRLLARPSKRVPCLWVRRNAAVRGRAKLSSCLVLKAAAGSAEPVPVAGRSGDRQVNCERFIRLTRCLASAGARDLQPALRAGRR